MIIKNKYLIDDDIVNKFINECPTIPDIFKESIIASITETPLTTYVIHIESTYKSEKKWFKETGFYFYKLKVIYKQEVIYFFSGIIPNEIVPESIPKIIVPYRNKLE